MYFSGGAHGGQRCLCWHSDVSAFLLCSLKFVIAIFFNSKEQMSFNFMAAVTVHSDFGGQENKIKSVTVSAFSPSTCHEIMGLDALILVLWILSFKLAFSPSSFTSSRGSLVPLHFLPLKWYPLDCPISLDAWILLFPSIKLWKAGFSSTLHNFLSLIPSNMLSL